MASRVREDYPFATPEDLAAAGREAFPEYPATVQDEGVGGWAYVNEDCRDVWKIPAAPTAMRQPVASSIPTLLISGSFDTLTSLAGAKAAAANWSRACCCPRVSLRPSGNRLVPWRSARPGHILRRRIEAA
jgi:alpha-beta hydrolase superfamily lysophospholipase